MNYTLKLELDGAAEISAMLKSLQDALKGLSGGSGSGSNNPVNLIKNTFAKLPNDVKKTGDELKKVQADIVTFYKNITMLAGPIFNPGGVLSTMFSVRQTFSALMTEKGQSIIGKMGLTGVAGAGIGTVAAVAGATALGLAFKALKADVLAMSEAYKKGSLIYGNALRSGLGLGMTSYRMSLSNILGVSEQEVFKFSGVLGELANKAKYASDIMAKNAQVLTGVEQQKKLRDQYRETMNAEVARTYSMFSYLNSKSDIWMLKHDIAGRTKINDFLEKLGLIAPRVNAPLSMMKQMPASAWEKMGLVVGGGMGSGPAVQTARNTQGIWNELRRLNAVIHHQNSPASGYQGYSKFMNFSSP